VAVIEFALSAVYTVLFADQERDLAAMAGAMVGRVWVTHTLGFEYAVAALAQARFEVSASLPRLS